MDISARLEEGEIQRLEDPGKLCGDVVRGLGGSGFEGSLRVKNTVDGIEEIGMCDSFFFLLFGFSVAYAGSFV